MVFKIVAFGGAHLPPPRSDSMDTYIYIYTLNCSSFSDSGRCKSISLVRGRGDVNFHRPQRVRFTAEGETVDVSWLGSSPQDASDHNGFNEICREAWHMLAY